MLNEYVVIDMEMTGLSPHKDKIIEIGAVKVKNGKVEDEYQKLIKPNVEIREKITKITGITKDMLKDKPLIGEILPDLFEFIGDNVLIGHSLVYDFSFMMQAAYDNNMLEECKKKWFGIDTLKIAKKKLSPEEKKTLAVLCKKYEISDEGHHRALNDVYMTNSLYIKLCEEFEKEDDIFLPEEYIYKPKKEKRPTKREIENAEKLIKLLENKPDIDIYSMNQSELSRYTNNIKVSLGILANKL